MKIPPLFIPIALGLGLAVLYYMHTNNRRHAFLTQAQIKKLQDEETGGATPTHEREVKRLLSSHPKKHHRTRHRKTNPYFSSGKEYMNVQKAQSKLEGTYGRGGVGSHTRPKPHIHFMPGDVISNKYLPQHQFLHAGDKLISI